MRRIGILVGISLALAVLPSEPAVAGIYSDELAKCLVRETTDGDRTFLVKWIFASASVHPAVRSIASVSDADRTELNKKVAKLVEKLLTESCKNETQEALKYEGPTVARSKTEFANHLDKQKFEKLFAPSR